ncbi:MAG: InlB B-repeat-containing protein [Solobacterium sp.]|nr:InlB B-repeat-containing protein [Solobacterium sp.]
MKVKTKNRLLAILLASMMVFQALPMHVYAEEPVEVTEEEVVEVIEEETVEVIEEEVVEETEEDIEEVEEIEEESLEETTFNVLSASPTPIEALVEIAPQPQEETGEETKQEVVETPVEEVQEEVKEETTEEVAPTQEQQDELVSEKQEEESQEIEEATNQEEISLNKEENKEQIEKEEIVEEEVNRGGVLEKEIVEEKNELEEEKEPDEEKEEVRYPAFSKTKNVNGVTVTLRAPEGSLPEGTDLRVEPVTATEVFEAVESQLNEKGQNLIDAVAFDVTPVDAEGNEVQPKLPVTVTFSGTGLALEEGAEVSVYRVSDDASTVTEMGTSTATADKQQFNTDHFTIYVSTGSTSDPNGDGSNQPNTTTHRLTLEYGQSATLETSHSRTSPTYWSISAGSSYVTFNTNTRVVTNNNTTGQDQNVTIRWRRSGTTTEYYYILAKAQVKEKYDVTFMLQDAGATSFETVKEEQVEEGSDATAPEEPGTKVVGDITYAFDGWYEDEDCTQSATLTNITEPKTFYAKYEVSGYNVVFKLQDAGATSFETVQEGVVDAGADAEAPEEPDTKVVGDITYAFNGWYEDEDCTVTADLTNISEPKTFYAKYEASAYNVVFKLQDAGESSFETVQESMVNEGEDAEAPEESETKTVDGKKYEFDGWYEDEDCTQSATLTNITEPKTFYAKYNLMKHTVTYKHKPAGESAFVDDDPASEEVDSGSAAQETPEHDAQTTVGDRTYDFDGWYVDEACTEEADLTKITDDITVYSRYVAEVTLTYLPGDTTEHVTLPDPDTLTDRSGTIITLGEASCTGYHFVGWADSTGSTYAGGSEYTLPEEDVELTAVWSQGTITVNYHVNWDNPTPETIIHTDENVPENNNHYKIWSSIPSREGYLFAGWSVNPSATDADHGALPGDDYPVAEEEVDFYAVWAQYNPDMLMTKELTAFGETLKYNGQEQSSYVKEIAATSFWPAGTIGVEEEDNPSTEGAYKYPGYVRVGRYSVGQYHHNLYAKVDVEAGFQIVRKEVGQESLPDEAHLYTHNSETNQFDAVNFVIPVKNNVFEIVPLELKVTTESAEKLYDGQPLTAGGTIEVDGGTPQSFDENGLTLELVTGESVTIKTTGTITEEGTAENSYEIDWGTVNPDNYGITEDLGTLEVYMNQVHYDANADGDTVDNMPADEESGVSYTISDQTPEREHYTFNGWNTKADGQGDDYDEGDTYTFPSDLQEVTFYAQWIIDEHDITYDPNGGEFEGSTDPTTKTYEYNEAITLGVEPTREHYHFLGWIDDEGDVHSAEEPYTVTKDATFTASWEIDHHWLTYDPNGGEFEESTDPTIHVHEYGEEIEIPEAATSEDGLIFKGWQEEDGNLYQPGDAYTVEDDATFVAQWKLPITFDPNGGTLDGSTDPKVVEYNPGDAVTIEQAAEREHYVFEEWNTAADGSGDSYQPGDTTEFAQATTLYAVWTLEQHVVTYNPNGGTYEGSTEPTEETHDYNEEITLGSAATRDHYNFLG